MVEFRPSGNKALLRVVAYLIAFFTLAVYLPALQNDFVDWDDATYVYENLEQYWDGSHVSNLLYKLFLLDTHSTRYYYFIS